MATSRWVAELGPHCLLAPNWMASWFILYTPMYWTHHRAFQIFFPLLFPSPLKQTISSATKILLSLSPLVPHKKNPSKAPAQLLPRAMFFQSSHALCELGDKSYQYFSCINWEKWGPEEINQDAGYWGCSLVQTAIYWTLENMSPCPAIVSMFNRSE